MTDEPSLADRLAEVADHPEVVIDHPQSLRVLSALADEAVEALRAAEAAMTAELGEGKIVAWIEKYGDTND